jgi:membrane protease YdiL (CAAX protease family)
MGDQPRGNPTFSSRWLVLLFAMILPGVMAWTDFVVLAPPGGAGPGYLALAAYAAAKILQFSLPIAWVWCCDRHRLRLGAPSWRGQAIGLAFGLLVFGFVLALYYGVLRDSKFLAGTPARVSQKVAQFHVDSPARYLLLVIFIGGIHSLLEEYYWRWFVFGELRRLIPVPAAIVLSGLAFMLHHIIVLAVYFPSNFWTAALPFSFCVGLGGTMWAWLYQRSQSIFACWSSHLIIDAAIMVVGYDMLFGSRI